MSGFLSVSRGHGNGMAGGYDIFFPHKRQYCMDHFPERLITSLKSSSLSDSDSSAVVLSGQIIIGAALDVTGMHGIPLVLTALGVTIGDV